MYNILMGFFEVSFVIIIVHQLTGFGRGGWEKIVFHFVLFALKIELFRLYFRHNSDTRERVESRFFYPKNTQNEGEQVKERLDKKSEREGKKLYISRFGDCKTNSAKICSFLSFCDSNWVLYTAKCENNLNKAREKEYTSIKFTRKFWKWRDEKILIWNFLVFL